MFASFLSPRFLKMRHRICNVSPSGIKNTIDSRLMCAALLETTAHVAFVTSALNFNEVLKRKVEVAYVYVSEIMSARCLQRHGKDVHVRPSRTSKKNYNWPHIMCALHLPKFSVAMRYGVGCLSRLH